MKIGIQNKILFIIGFSSLSICAYAQEKPAASAEELAKKLANPIAGLISVPLQNNIDYEVVR